MITMKTAENLNGHGPKYIMNNGFCNIFLRVRADFGELAGQTENWLVAVIEISTERVSHDNKYNCKSLLLHSHPPYVF